MQPYNINILISSHFSSYVYHKTKY